MSTQPADVFGERIADISADLEKVQRARKAVEAKRDAAAFDDRDTAALEKELTSIIKREDSLLAKLRAAQRLKGESEQQEILDQRASLARQLAEFQAQTPVIYAKFQETERLCQSLTLDYRRNLARVESLKRDLGELDRQLTIRKYGADPSKMTGTEWRAIVKAHDESEAEQAGA